MTTKLIVGLGNPGNDYAKTRHNVGFWAIDALCANLGFGDFNRLAKSKFNGLLADTTVDTADGMCKLLMLKPTTFMNRSGDAVGAALRFYKLDPADLMVIVDELQLPAGRIKLGADGSHGGHNGLRDIQQKLGTKAYPRLRIGIDRPPAGFAQVNYVLGRPTPEQKPKLDEAVKKAAAALISWADAGLEKTMSHYNQK
ncbi:MAG: aminoacyl-tRNA hydrolase [Planctomycetota bacterium]